MRTIFVFRALVPSAVLLCMCASSPARSSIATPGHVCTQVASPLARLACFDAAAGTPSHVSPPAPDVDALPPIIDLVRANEKGRLAGDARFLMTQTAEGPLPASQQRVVISAPATGHTSTPVLAISCLSNISHLQFVMAQPLAGNVARIALILDDRPAGTVTRWQVLSSGRVVDAGRGMPAIAMIRQLAGGNRLRIESDVPELDGQVFDVSSLGAQIAAQRAACRW